MLGCELYERLCNDAAVRCGDGAMMVSCHVLVRPVGLFRMVGQASASNSYAFVRFRILVEYSKCTIRAGYIGVMHC